jgi:hypothetical protein
MLRRAYLFLVLVRLYFALSPSYLHPDENFQGPEVIAGELSIRYSAALLELCEWNRILKAQELRCRIQGAT